MRDIVLYLSMVAVLPMVVLTACQEDRNSNKAPAVQTIPSTSRNFINSTQTAQLGPGVGEPNSKTLGVYTNDGCAVGGTSGEQLFLAPSEATYSLSGPSGSSFRMKFCLQLLGDPDLIEYWNEKAPHHYIGFLEVAGTLTVTNTAKLGSCKVPAGSYTLTTMQSGFYNPVSFSVPEIEAVSGSTRMILQLRQGFKKDLNADSLVDRLALSVAVINLSENDNEPIRCLSQAIFLN